MEDNNNQNEQKFINPNIEGFDGIIGDPEPEPFKEKPYYMKDDVKINFYEKYLERYDELNKYFLKIFSLLLIQFILIIFFTFLGFHLSLNLFIIETSNSMIWTVGIVTLIISFLCFGVLKIKEEMRKNPLLYIYLGVYIPCIALYCFLLSDYSEISYIMLVLYIISMDFFGMLLYIIIFTIQDYKFLIAPVITSTAMLLIFHYSWDIPPVITIKISSVALSAIIYIGIISVVCKNLIDKEHFLFATIIFNLAIFAPVAVLVFIALVIIITFLDESEKQKKKKKKNIINNKKKTNKIIQTQYGFLGRYIL